MLRIVPGRRNGEPKILEADADILDTTSDTDYGFAAAPCADYASFIGPSLRQGEPAENR
jgi:hypothetical protein